MALAAALLVTASLAATAPPASASGDERASAAAQRTISLGNFIVNRDVLNLRGGQTTNVVALCPGKTRFFTSGFRPFGVQRGAPRVNFIVTAIIPRPNGVTYRFFNPQPLNTFPVNIRVSAMCLKLGTVSVGGASTAASGDDGALAAAKKGKKKKKGKPKLKAKVVVEKVKVPPKKKKGKKKRKGARSSAEARTAILSGFDIAAFCTRENEIPTAFGFEHGPTSQFLGVTPTRRRGDVGLVGNFLFDGIDRLKFFVLCMRGQGGVNLGATINGKGKTPPAPSIVNNIFQQGPNSGGIPLGDGSIQQFSYGVPGNSNSIAGMPPFPTGISWKDPSFVGNTFEREGDLPDMLFVSPSPAPAVFSQLTLEDLIPQQFGSFDPLGNDLFAPPPEQGFPQPVGAPQCSDLIDNPDPEDTAVDGADPGCLSAEDVDEKHLPGTGPCPPPGPPATFSSAPELTNGGSTMVRHQLKINGAVAVDEVAPPPPNPDFLVGSTTIMDVDCGGGTTVDVTVFWTVTGTTVVYDFFVSHKSGPGGGSFSKTIAADTRE